MRQMQNMMNSFFGSPFGNDMYGGGGVGGGGGRSRSMSLMPFDDDRGMMSPFGFPNMNNMGNLMRSMSQMQNNPNCHSFSSSSVMTMTTGPDGKPQVSNHCNQTALNYTLSTNQLQFRFIKPHNQLGLDPAEFVKRKRAFVTAAPESKS